MSEVLRGSAEAIRGITYKMSKDIGGRAREGVLTKIRSKGFTGKERVDFCSQLAVLLQARVSLLHSLEVLARQSRRSPARMVIEDLSREIRKGVSFDRALARQPGVFDTLFVVTAEVGEESGRLPEVLLHLAEHLEKMNGLSRKFSQAMAYPVLVLSVAVLTVSFLLLFIVPSFAEMFKSFQVELPASTKVILALSGFLTDYGTIGAGVLVLIGILSVKSIRGKGLQAFAGKHVLRIPLLGDIVRKTYVARFCRTLGTMLQSQVSLVDALSTVERIATHEEMKSEIRKIQKHVRQGKAVADPIADSTFFPPMVVQMISVGEETSELDKMLLKVADYFEREIDASVEVISSVIEPVIVVFLGLLVGAILVSLYMPMFELVNLMGGY
jgi:type IV pilus assembly protein PilC